MSRDNGMADDGSGFTVAGVKFTLTGAIDLAALGSVFDPFRGGSPEADLACVVNSRGADVALLSAALDPDRPWSFQAHEGVCRVTRRIRDGDTVWRIVAPLSYDRFEVTWHPLLFPELYVSCERAWSTDLGRVLLLLRLHRQGGLIVHGMAAELEGLGVLCLGVSGSGKSTIARLLHEAGASVLSDERPVLRRWPPPTAVAVAPGQAASFRVYGSPWHSSGGFVRNAWVPLKRIYLLSHGHEDRLTPIAPRAAITRLIQVAAVMWQDPLLMDPCLATLDDLLGAVPCAELAFRPTAAVVELIKADLRQPAT